MYLSGNNLICNMRNCIDKQKVITTVTKPVDTTFFHGNIVTLRTKFINLFDSIIESHGEDITCQVQPYDRGDDYGGIGCEIEFIRVRLESDIEAKERILSNIKHYKDTIAACEGNIKYFEGLLK